MDLFKKIFDQIREVDRGRLREEKKLRTSVLDSKSDIERIKAELTTSVNRINLIES